MKRITKKRIEQFRTQIYAYYAHHRRSFVWREHPTPYTVLVSEVMLQQTQTGRVAQKFDEFMSRFPTIDALAHASLKDVITAWQGLGYNRRARALHQAAQIIVSSHAGIVPDDPIALDALPGIGKATAASIAAFAYNKPTVFIETNIRAVYLELFFKGEAAIHDDQIMPLVEKTLDHTQPREWYYALMDYGVMLKKHIPNPNRRSATYTRQSTFEGSDRQIRGLILKALTTNQHFDLLTLSTFINREPERVKKCLISLHKDGLIHYQGNALAGLCPAPARVVDP